MIGKLIILILISNVVLEFQNKDNIKRKLELNLELTEERGKFEDLKFFYDFKNFEQNFPPEWTADQKTLIINSIKKAGGVLESFISMFKSEEKMLFPKIAAKNEYNLDVWEDIFKLDEAQNYDFCIAVFFNFKETGNTPASTEIMYTNDLDIPLFTVIKLNKDFLNDKLESYYLESLFLHELTHSLGFHSYLFCNDPFNSIISTKEINGKNHYYITSKNVVDFAKDYFDCQSLEGVEIEEGEDDCPGSHWSSRILLGEYMTDFAYPEEQVISGFTLALFEDLQYLKVKKKYTGGLMRFGKHKGCDFVNSKCIGGSNKYENEFYYPTNLDDLNLIEPSCSSGRLSRTIYKLYAYDSDISPSEYQYFSNKKVGGIPLTNYCPVSEYPSSDSIFIGRCSQKGEPSELASALGESLSANSFCALSSLMKSGNTNYDGEVRAVCFEMFCSDKSLTILVGDNYFVCPRGGGKIDGVGYDGYLLCPDYNLICTGSAICNDMFDCINKKSEENTGIFNYDYDIITTQDSSVYKEAETVIGHELSENKNTCPIYCSQCNKNKLCVRCGKNFVLKGNVCENKIKNCIEYDDDESCKKCKDGYALIKEKNNNKYCLEESKLGIQYYSETESDITYYIKCSDTFDNCLSCSSTACTSCINNYGLFNDGTSYACVDLSSKKYYYDSESSLYKLCSEKINGCDTCSKSSNSEINCIQCLENYAIVYGEPETCSLESALKNDDSLFKDNDGKYYPCSDNKFHNVENCAKCKDKESCESCQDGYNLYNSKKLCLMESDINEKKYYLDPSDGFYYLCSKKINGCNKCNDGNKCLECNSEFALDENDKCIHLSQRSKYYLDPITLRYVSCSKIENCEECSSSTQCLKCKSGFKLNNSLCEKDENKDKYKAIAIAALIISIIALIGVGIILLLLLRNIFSRSPNLVTSATNEFNGEEVESIEVKKKKRSIHNEVKTDEL